MDDITLSVDDLLMLAREARMEALEASVRQAALQNPLPHASTQRQQQQQPPLPPLPAQRPPLGNIPKLLPNQRQRLGAAPKRMDDHRVPLWNSRLQRRQEGQCAPKRK